MGRKESPKGFFAQIFMSREEAIRHTQRHGMSTTMLALTIAAAVSVVAGVAMAVWAHGQQPGGPIEIAGLDPGARPWATSVLVGAGLGTAGGLLWLAPMMLAKSFELIMSSRGFRLLVSCAFMITAGIMVAAPWLWAHDLPVALGFVGGVVFFIPGFLLVAVFSSPET